MILNLLISLTSHMKMSQDIRSFFKCTPKANKATTDSPVERKQGKKRLIIDSDSDEELVLPKSKRDKSAKESSKKTTPKTKKSPTKANGSSKYFEIQESVKDIFGRSPVKRISQPKNDKVISKKNTPSLVEDLNESGIVFSDDDDWINEKCSQTTVKISLQSVPSKVDDSSVKSPLSGSVGDVSPIKVQSPLKINKDVKSLVRPRELSSSPEKEKDQTSPLKTVEVKKRTIKSPQKFVSNSPTPSKKIPEKQTVRSTDSFKISPIIRPAIAKSELWVDKYKPSSVKQIIGQQGDKSNVNKLLRWLRDWHKNQCGDKKLVRPSPWAKDDSGAYFKAALLSGPPGVGKTTTAHLVCKELEMDLVEFNASDTRSKKLLNQEVSELLSSKSLTPFFAGNGGGEVTKKHVLVMDEVDGMAGNEDRGGVQELIQLIKSSKVPVICMCNDRNHPKIRSLANYCFDLRFNRPRVEQIKGAMLSICFKEKLKVKPDVLTDIITNTNQDIRLILNHLSLLSAAADKDMKASTKDIKIGPWDVVRKVFSEEEHKTMSIHDKSDLFFNDYSIAPLFVQENYLSVVPHSKESKSKLGKIKLFAKAAESIANGDLVDRAIRSQNAWSLLPTQAMFSSLIPGEVLEGHMGGQINFPGWLGKNSRKNKLDRLAQEIQAHVRLKISGNKKAVVMDYAKVLRDTIVMPLSVAGSEGVSDSLELLKEYSLLREDLDSLSELTSWNSSAQADPFSKLDSKVKAAFTRAYNKAQIVTPFAVPSAKKKSLKRDNDQTWGSEDEEDEEIEDDSTELDSMIKVKKPDKKANSKTEESGPSKASKGKGARGGKRAKK